MAQAAASRYARALADLVLDPARGLSPETAASELAVFEGAMAGSSELGNVLLSPAVTPARKRAVIARLGSAIGMSRLVTELPLRGHRSPAHGAAPGDPDGVSGADRRADGRA